MFSLPIAGYLAPAIGFIFPKTLLPPQFWSSPQRLHFMLEVCQRVENHHRTSGKTALRGIAGADILLSIAMQLQGVAICVSIPVNNLPVLYGCSVVVCCRCFPGCYEAGGHTFPEVVAAPGDAQGVASTQQQSSTAAVFGQVSWLSLPLRQGRHRCRSVHVVWVGLGLILAFAHFAFFQRMPLP